jgi:hypothetical protein
MMPSSVVHDRRAFQSDLADAAFCIEVEGSVSVLLDCNLASLGRVDHAMTNLSIPHERGCKNEGDEVDVEPSVPPPNRLRQAGEHVGEPAQPTPFEAFEALHRGVRHDETDREETLEQKIKTSGEG